VRRGLRHRGVPEPQRCGPTTRMIETTYGRLIESMDADIAACLSSTAPSTTTVAIHRNGWQPIRAKAAGV